MSTSTTSSPAAAPAELFQPFEWVTRAFRTGEYDLVANAHDLAGGACVIMEMIEQSELNVGHDDAPIFNDHNRGRLLRMAIAAMRTIELETAAHLEKMQERGEQKARHAAGLGGAR